MKCPYCGAEVTPNTKCEYCDSFVERETKADSSKSEYQENLEKIIIETAEHFADGLQNASENFEDTVKAVATPAAKRIFKKIILFIVIFAAITMIGIFIMIFSAFRSSFSFMKEISDVYMDTSSSTSQKSNLDVRSLTDKHANVIQLTSDGSISLSYDGEEFQSTLLDQQLLDWLNEGSRSIDGIDVLFTTDNSGNITSLAMSSHTFFVLAQQGSDYLVLREGSVFRTTAEAPLEIGKYYGGYFNYPKLNAHIVSSESGSGYSLFDPVCEAKEMQTFTDAYTGEEISLPMLYVDDAWFYCSQEIYGECTQGQVIPIDVLFDKSMGVIYID